MWNVENEGLTYVKVEDWVLHLSGSFNTTFDISKPLRSDSKWSHAGDRMKCTCHMGGTGLAC
jgi:hypothetical protein